MTETARLVLTAAVLSGIGLGTLAWRVARIDPAAPDRLIGELRVAQLAALFLAAVAAMPIGLAIGGPLATATPLDAAFGLGFLAVAGYVLFRDPRQGLWIAAGAFILHALVDVAHRPGWLTPDLAPAWFFQGSALFDVYLAGLCAWARWR